MLPRRPWAHDRRDAHRRGVHPGQSRHRASLDPVLGLPRTARCSRSPDAADPEPGYECFGERDCRPVRRRLSGLDQSDWITAWAPGGEPSTTPSGYGTELWQVDESSSRCTTTCARNKARTRQVRLRLTDKKLKALKTTLLPAPVELPCAPGESGRLLQTHRRGGRRGEPVRAGSGATIAGLRLLLWWGSDAPKAGDVQACDRRVTTASTVFSVAGHMHLLGHEISVILNPGQAETSRFCWTYRTGISTNKAASRCAVGRHRTGRHPAGCGAARCFIAIATARVAGHTGSVRGLGEGTTDEMCLAICDQRLTGNTATDARSVSLHLVSRNAD